jgi:hypothetical protein
VTASADAGAKDSGHGSVDVDEQETGSASAWDPPVQVESTYTCEASVLDVALVSGRTGAIDRDAICVMLIKCLQDVCSITFVVHLLVIYSLASNIRLFLQ